MQLVLVLVLVLVLGGENFYVGVSGSAGSQDGKVGFSYFRFSFCRLYVEKCSASHTERERGFLCFTFGFPLKSVSRLALHKSNLETELRDIAEKFLGSSRIFVIVSLVRFMSCICD